MGRGRHPLHYHLCANLPLDDLPFKTNWPLTILLILSFAIHIFVNGKIKLLNLKQKQSFDVRTFADHLKFGDISSMDMRSMSDYLTGFVTVAIISLFLISTAHINSENPLELTKVIFFALMFCLLNFTINLTFTKIQPDL
jgi:hypothetical protein